jgi:lysophospholipase L1-like esterase
MTKALRGRAASAWALIVAAAALLTACAMAPGRPAQTPTPGATIAAFYGDSYTRGTGATSPERRWSTIVCDERGWYEFNPSVDGLGFVNNRGLALEGDLVEQIIEHEPAPDIVIVTMGLNDNFSMPAAADEIESAIGADLERLRTELPDARLVVVEPFWYQDERPDSVEQIIAWVDAAAERVGADYIAGASRWLEGHPEWMAADLIHPNDDGYAEIAERMDEELRELGL